MKANTGGPWARRDAWQRAAVRARTEISLAVVDGFFRGASRLGSVHPDARPERHGVERLRDVPYRPTGLPEHLLDVYRPVDRQGPLRTVLYVHGGGFRLLSKDTHWLMGLAFARAGAVVFSVNYRLAPRAKFPAAIEDVCAAYEWALDNAAAYGADPNNLVLAGESAGANLITALTVALSYRRPERFAASVHERGVLPKAVLPACGIFQVTDARRFDRLRLSSFVRDQIHDVERAYLPADLPRTLDALALADPLVWLERGPDPARPLPPFLAQVGTLDPLLDDTRRLAAAVARHGARAEARYYPGGVHAFHAFVFLEVARRAWRDMLAFAAEHAPNPGAQVPAPSWR